MKLIQIYFGTLSVLLSYNILGGFGFIIFVLKSRALKASFVLRVSHLPNGLGYVLPGDRG